MNQGSGYKAQNNFCVRVTDTATAATGLPTRSAACHQPCTGLQVPCSFRACTRSTTSTRASTGTCPAARLAPSSSCGAAGYFSLPGSTTSDTAELDSAAARLLLHSPSLFKQQLKSGTQASPLPVVRVVSPPTSFSQDPARASPSSKACPALLSRLPLYRRLVPFGWVRRPSSVPLSTPSTSAHRRPFFTRWRWIPSRRRHPQASLLLLLFFSSFLWPFGSFWHRGPEKKKKNTHPHTQRHSTQHIAHTTRHTHSSTPAPH